MDDFHSAEMADLENGVEATLSSLPLRGSACADLLRSYGVDEQALSELASALLKVGIAAQRLRMSFKKPA